MKISFTRYPYETIEKNIKRCLTSVLSTFYFRGAGLPESDHIGINTTVQNTIMAAMRASLERILVDFMIQSVSPQIKIDFKNEYSISVYVSSHSEVDVAESNWDGSTFSIEINIKRKHIDDILRGNKKPEEVATIIVPLILPHFEKWRTINNLELRGGELKFNESD